MKTILAALLALFCLPALSAEVIPPAPKQYFNDYAHVVSSGTAAQLNAVLENFERETSSQIVVAIFQKMESDSSIEDYTVRVAQSWKVGQKGKDNGAVLFVFIQDRKMYLQVGYGLEGALPDAIAKRIIEDEIKPHFKSGNFDAGLTAGVNAILAATKGEYKGNGRTVGGRSTSGNNSMAAIIPILIFVAILLLVFKSRRRGWGGSGWIIGGGGWGGGSGGGFSGGSGGGFSGGGGSFGGGGAGGSW